ncbi:MAG TPA: ATP-binding cassette domain-containing protein [Candidatus Fimousia stercorigallinarum]|nr:ATP-binding cassette domain-containing protein [Candidatus Fimousia stercorigallinarum]
MELRVEHVTKKIKGRTILSDVCLCLTEGRIYGFVGRNGSGKTMLFRAVSGLMKPTSGRVVLDGKELHKDMQVLPDMGIVIENAGLYRELTGLENLKLLSKLNKKIGEEEIREAIQRLGLDPDDRRPFGKYSLGMKQRIVLAQAFMEKPSILLLDEPTNALDEEGMESVRRIILEEKKRGALILIASHNRTDIDVLADEVYEVKEGKVSRKEAPGRRDADEG